MRYEYTSNMPTSVKKISLRSSVKNKYPLRDLSHAYPAYFKHSHLTCRPKILVACRLDQSFLLQPFGLLLFEHDHEPHESQI